MTNLLPPGESLSGPLPGARNLPRPSRIGKFLILFYINFQRSSRPEGVSILDSELAIADLTTPSGADTAIGRAVDGWGGVDVLVNNAGWSVAGFIATDTDRDKWLRTIEINLFSAIATTQAAIGPMKAAGAGSIMFIASDAAFGQIRQGVYGASKAAVVALARTTAREHGRHGIRSNVVCPGLVIPDGPDAIGASSL
jgi:2-hydroxycyclohexanecarboxyl-CoA dehydrogenase